MMHTFRLLDMALEILRDGAITVKRPNREELLGIRKGIHEYNDLLTKAEDKLAQVEAAYATSLLPDMPNTIKANKLLVEIRKGFYMG